MAAEAVVVVAEAVAEALAAAVAEETEGSDDDDNDDEDNDVDDEADEWSIGAPKRTRSTAAHRRDLSASRNRSALSGVSSPSSNSAGDDADDAVYYELEDEDSDDPVSCVFFSYFV